MFFKHKFKTFLNSPGVLWTENIWCVFRVKPPFSNSSSGRGLRVRAKAGPDGWGLPVKRTDHRQSERKFLFTEPPLHKRFHLQEFPRLNLTQTHYPFSGLLRRLLTIAKYLDVLLHCKWSRDFYNVTLLISFSVWDKNPRWRTIAGNQLVFEGHRIHF